MSDKQQIQDWQKKVRNHFGDESKMYEYLFETMDNFYYRYLETSSTQNLKTLSFGNHLWGARSTETSMMDALKIQNPIAKKAIIELAKKVPKAKNPSVSFELRADVKELTTDHGVIHFTSIINWDHSELNQEMKELKKSVTFKYEDLGQFRKELALKLEEVCEIFL